MIKNSLKTVFTTEAFPIKGGLFYVFMHLFIISFAQVAVTDGASIVVEQDAVLYQGNTNKEVWSIDKISFDGAVNAPQTRKKLGYISWKKTVTKQHRKPIIKTDLSKNGIVVIKSKSPKESFSESLAIELFCVSNSFRYHTKEVLLSKHVQLIQNVLEIKKVLTSKGFDYYQRLATLQLPSRAPPFFNKLLL